MTSAENNILPPREALKETKLETASGETNEHDGERDASADTGSDQEKASSRAFIPNEGKGKGQLSIIDSHSALENVQNAEEEQCGLPEFTNPQGLRAYLVEDPQHYEYLFRKQKCARDALEQTHDVNTRLRGQEAADQSAPSSLRTELEILRNRLKVIEMEQDQGQSATEASGCGHKELRITQSATTTPSDTTIDHTQMTSPLLEPPVQNRRAYKIPDPSMLTGGNPFKFDGWRIAIERKLKANAHQFPSATFRKAYIISQLKRKAYEQLIPRLLPGSKNSFEDGVDILDHLESIYVDPNRRWNARDSFNRPYMGDHEKFATFLATFFRLADEADISCVDRVDLLWQKVNVELQYELILMVDLPGVTFSRFVKFAHRMARFMDIMEVGRDE